MRRKLLAKYRQIACSEKNLQKYNHSIFGVFWTCTKGLNHIVYCDHIIMHKPFDDWWSARRQNGTEVRSFFLNDPHVFLFVENGK